MKSINIPDELFYELIDNYTYRNDQSYALHTAYDIWELMKEQYPEEFEEK